jgi:hypothetical protein
MVVRNAFIWLDKNQWLTLINTVMNRISYKTKSLLAVESSLIIHLAYQLYNDAFQLHTLESIFNDELERVMITEDSVIHFQTD